MKYVILYEKFGKLEDKLHYAIAKQDISIVKELIKDGVDINAKNSDGETALLYALIYIDDDIIELLIGAGADLNVKNDNSTPLITSAYNGWMKRVKMFIEAGADWNIKDEEDKDFLDYLRKKKKEKIINLYPELYKEYLMKKDAEKYNL